MVLESFRPGVLDRLGVGWEALRRVNPRLVLCSISGYGQDGPYRALAGHDLDYCAIAGVLAVNGPAERPVPLGVQVADLCGGAWPAVAGILAALLRRGVTGQGAHVDISMADGVAAMLTMPQAMADARGTPLEREREQLNGGAACYRVYRTADGRHVALGALEPQFFARFCAAAGVPELAERQFDDGGRGPVEALTALFATRTRDEWARLGHEHDCCLAPVLTGDEPRSDPQLQARGLFLEVETPWEGQGHAVAGHPGAADRGTGAAPAGAAAGRRHRRRAARGRLLRAARSARCAPRAWSASRSVAARRVGLR